MEQWTAYTREGQETGHVLTRGQAIPEGFYHLVVECIVRHTDASILFMKRAADKPSYPSYWEASAGGSALLGEQPLEAVLREVAEETGLTLQPDSLICYHRFIADEDHCLFHCYLAETAVDQAAISLQEGETTDFIWVPQEELERFLADQPVIPRQKEVLTSLFLDGKKPQSL